MSNQPIKPAHLALAVAVMAVWGSNFVVIKHALGELPPLLFATLRYTAVLLPALFFVKRPKVSWGNLAAYGLLIGCGQFGLLFIAMRSSISPGIASLVMQTQVIFTIALAAIFGGERPQPAQYAGLILSSAGIATIMIYTDGSITPLGLALTLGAAASWAGGNIVARRAGKVEMLGYVVWAAIFAVPPLFALSWIMEGPQAMAAGVAHATWITWASRQPFAAVQGAVRPVDDRGTQAPAAAVDRAQQHWPLSRGDCEVRVIAIELHVHLVEVPARMAEAAHRI